MNRILKIGVNEILSDAKQCSEMVTAACCRSGAFRVTGCCATATCVFVVLEPAEDASTFYRFSPFPSLSEADIEAEISSRYFAGFSTLGSFAAGDTLWGLFACPAEVNENDAGGQE